MITDNVTRNINHLINSVSPAARRQMALEISRKLRDQTSKTIRANTTPGGESMPARKHQAHPQPGRTGRMFKKLAQRSSLQVLSSPAKAELTFKSKYIGLATIHHFGKEGIVNKRRNIKYKYASRLLMGITSQNETDIQNIIIQHLSGNL